MLVLGVMLKLLQTCRLGNVLTAVVPGTGFVIDVEGDGAERTFKVQYDKSATGAGKSSESGIAYSRIAERASPYFATSKPMRERKIPENFDKENIPPTSVVATRMEISNMMERLSGRKVMLI
jgi:hypothetical protein